jgi:protein SCO1
MKASAHGAIPIVLAILLALAVTGPALAQRAEPAPEETEGVDIKPNIGAQIPLDAVFVDENGKEIRLRDYITGDKPVIMSLGYYRCPLLCDLVLNGVVDALKGVEWDPGDQFEMITISIDPKETPTLAKLKKQNYVRGYGKPSANRGWHFLTGKQESITAVANAVGFYYRYDEKQDQFIHGAAVFLLTPDGKLSRCLRGIMFDSQTVRLSLAEASEGKQVSTFDSLLLLCFHYDETEGTYSLQAMNVMRIGGVMVMVVLAAILFPAWLRSRKRKTDIPKPEDG